MLELPLSGADIQKVGGLAGEAGKLAVQMRKGVAIREKTGPNDLVTDADEALSRLLLKSLRKWYPDDLFISEEEQKVTIAGEGDSGRVWFIDPIDGTLNYVRNDGQWSVMVGLILAKKPLYGWVYQPSTNTLFEGGPAYGAFKTVGDGTRVPIGPARPYTPGARMRVMMNSRDKRNHPWIAELQNVDWVRSGSVGLKVARILADQADLFIHLGKDFNYWDTLAPCALAMGAKMDVCQHDGSPLDFTPARMKHTTSVIMGRPGTAEWARTHLEKPQGD